LGVIEFNGPEQNMRQAELLEQSLHKQFVAHQRFLASWVGSEWFNPAPEILEYIAQHCCDCEQFGLVSSVAKHGPGLLGGA
jgi:hypothetical protein